MAITNPVHESISTSAEDVTIIPETGADFLRVKALDGGGIVALTIKSIGGRTLNSTTPVIGNDNLHYLPAAAGAEVVIPVAIRGQGTEAERTVVVSAIASAAAICEFWLDQRTG